MRLVHKKSVNGLCLNFKGVWTTYQLEISTLHLLKRKLDEAIQTNSSPEALSGAASSKVPVPICTEEEVRELYKNLSKCDVKPSILSLIPEYSDSYVPKASIPQFPRPLSLLYDPNFLKLSYPELLEKCEHVDVSVSSQMSLLVEKETRNQSQSKLWFKYRSGRITASKMKSVCHTDSTNPSQSLIKQICYPQSFVFHSKWTDWGCSHEKLARNRYEHAMKTDHEDFSVSESGLVISSEWPFIGATPDGKVTCSCCGDGVVEIKCPYCHKYESIECAANLDKKFCLKKGHDDRLHLNKSHAYYYQVQTQLFVTDTEYCDFCVCTFADDEENGLHIERISKDEEFWSDCVSKAHILFRTSILPELLGKWYTRSNKVYSVSFDLPSSSSAGNETSEFFCYCKGPDSGDMIACDNDNCSIEWFHLSCLKMTSFPKGKSKWYCPDCRKLPQFIRKKKGKSKL